MFCKAKTQHPALEKAKWFYIMLYALASKSEFWLSLEVNL